MAGLNNIWNSIKKGQNIQANAKAQSMGQEKVTPVTEQPKLEPQIEETYIENSDEAVANAKPGQKLKRKNGDVVELSENDITAAKNKIATPVEKTETETDDMDFEQIASAPETESLLQNAKEKAEINGTSATIDDESKAEVVQYMTDMGLPQDENGTIEIPTSADKLARTLGVLTVVSGVLAALTGNILPVVDFTSFATAGYLGEDVGKATVKIQAAIENYAKILDQQGINAKLKEEVQGDIEASKLAEGISEEGTSKLARMNAAKQGNTAVVQTEVQGDLNKQLAEINNKYGIDLQKLIGEQTLQQINANTNAQTIILTLAQQLKNTAQAEQLKAYADVIEQMSDDDLARVAKGIKSEKGITNFDNAMTVVDKALEGVGVVVNAVK